MTSPLTTNRSAQGAMERAGQRAPDQPRGHAAQQPAPRQRRHHGKHPPGETRQHQDRSTVELETKFKGLQLRRRPLLRPPPCCRLLGVCKNLVDLRFHL